MRKLFLIILIVAALIGGAAVYLIATTPSRSTAIRFPLSDAQRRLLAQVPESAEAFALIPAAAALEPKLRANPVTAQAVDAFEVKQALPRPWMIGGADLLAWRTRDGNRYLVHLDPFRAFLVRTYMMIGGDIGDRVLINVAPEGPIDAGELQQIVALTNKLPPADALVVQRASSRGAFPPIARPAVTAVSITPQDITLVSRAARENAEPPGAVVAAHFPKSAVLAASFGNPPRVVEDLNRLFGAHVSTLLEGGGSVFIYDVDDRKLLPRPIGVIAVPDDPARRAARDAIVNQANKLEALGVRPRTAEHGGELLLAFDDSIDTYIKDAQEPPRWPANGWSLRGDPQRLVPILKGLSGNVGLRIAAPRLFRSARDLGHWIDALQQASAIEAAASSDGAEEQLNVRIATK